MWQSLLWKWAWYSQANTVLWDNGTCAMEMDQVIWSWLKMSQICCCSGKTLVQVAKISLVLRTLLSPSCNWQCWIELGEQHLFFTFVILGFFSVKLWLSILQGIPTKVAFSRSIFGISWYKKECWKVERVMACSNLHGTPNLHRGCESYSREIVMQESQWDTPLLGISNRISGRIQLHISAQMRMTFSRGRKQVLPLFSCHRAYGNRCQERCSVTVHCS